MRNLKKLIAVIMVVAMIASLMVPALAAQNEDLAKMLQELGLFKGYSDTELGLDDGLTREQALAFMLRVMGLEDEVQAMDAEEVAEYMGRVVDPETVTATWAHPYVAYAIKHDLTRGVNSKIYPNVEFDGQRVISGKEFIRFILNGLGFTPEVVGWDDVLDKAQEIGLLTAGEVVRYGSIQEMTRDEAVYVLVSALDATTVDGITLAQALYNAGAVDKETLAKYGYAVEEPTPVEEPLAMTVTAKKANVLAVEFNNEVDTENVTLTVKKGASKVSVDKTEWSTNKKVATITTTANMTAGTYTVEAKIDEETTLTASVEVKNQYVAEIKILNEVALTNEASTRAYVYYDVVDQYGESMRNAASIEWSFSAQRDVEKRSEGLIILKKDDKGEAVFTYGEKIYVTGVYPKNGTTVTAVLSVGPKQAIDSVEIFGFVKKGTTTILSTLPAGFKKNEYYMIYKVADQNGNPIVADAIENPVTSSAVTFISDNVLVIQGFDKDSETTLNIDGTEYYAIMVDPGVNVNVGGEVNITAISNKTGNKTVKNIAVGEYQILTSFTMSMPSGVIADGEKVEIPFTALDQNGNEIKNFVTLARQSDFNRLTLTASTGNFYLKENDDGTASLIYEDKDPGWDDSQTTDGIDRTVSLSAVVVGGSTDSLMLSIQDKARPVAIADVAFDTVLVKDGSDEIKFEDITFIDQYGRKFDKGNDNGFFKHANTEGLKGNDFAGYKFAVRVTLKGENGLFKIEGDGNAVKVYETPTPATIEQVIDLYGADDVVILKALAPENVSTAKSGVTLKFEIVKYANNEVKKYEKATSVSPAKNFALTVVDIKAVSGFTVDDLNKFYVETAKSGDLTGVSGSIKIGEQGIEIDDPIDDATIRNEYKQEVVVKGKYAGKEVKIPAKYLEIVSNKLSASGENPAVIDAVYEDGFKWSDFYDATTARYIRKDAEFKIDVVIKDVVNKSKDKSGNDVVDVVDVISKDVLASDEAPKMSTITGPDAITYNPTNGVIIIEVNNEDGKILGEEFKFKDQYGVDYAVTPTFKVSSIVENEEGYADNSFTVSGNDTKKVEIKGAERGDTFVLTIKAGNVTKVVNITVGADNNAKITKEGNVYKEELLKKLVE